MWVVEEREDRGFVDAAGALLEELRLIWIWLWSGEGELLVGVCVDACVHAGGVLGLEIGRAHV